MIDEATAAERAVLGAALMSGGQTMADCPLLADEFYRPPHGELWGLLQSMVRDGAPIEPTAVAVRLLDAPIKGIDATYLHTLFAEVSVTASAGYYARIVRDHADLRAIQAAGQRMVQASTSGEAESAKAHARKALDALDARVTGTATVEIAEAVIDVIRSIEEGTAPGLSTPWYDLDRTLGGLRPGGLYVIGARPGLGKSLVALQLAWHFASKHGPALFHSLEMPTGELVRRVLSQVSQVSFTSLSRSQLGELEWDRLSAHVGEVTSTPLHIDDRGTIRVDEIAASARRIRGLTVLVVDYAQLVAPSDRRLPREQQVAETSRSLKVLAKDLGVPVVLLAQLNRGPEARSNKRPALSDLRESGALEQDADVVALLFRDEDAAPDVLEVGVQKNRQGPTGVVKLHWDAAHMRVTSRARGI